MKNYDRFPLLYRMLDGYSNYRPVKKVVLRLNSSLRALWIIGVVREETLKASQLHSQKVISLIFDNVFIMLINFEEFLVFTL